MMKFLIMKTIQETVNIKDQMAFGMSSYNAIRNGVILKSDEPVRVRFETKIMSRYLDEQYHIKRHTRESLKRIARSGFR